MNDFPAAAVTVADLYHELVGLRSDVALVLTKMERSEARSSNFEHTQADHENRIRNLETALPTSLEIRIMALEKFRWMIVGALIVINALGVIIEWLVLKK